MSRHTGEQPRYTCHGLHNLHPQVNLRVQRTPSRSNKFFKIFIQIFTSLSLLKYLLQYLYSNIYFYIFTQIFTSIYLLKYLLLYLYLNIYSNIYSNIYFNIFTQIFTLISLLKYLLQYLYSNIYFNIFTQIFTSLSLLKYLLQYLYYFGKLITLDLILSFHSPHTDHASTPYIGQRCSQRTILISSPRTRKPWTHCFRTHPYLSDPIRVLADISCTTTAGKG